MNRVIKLLIYILFLDFLVVQCDISCKNRDGNDVKWWIYLADTVRGGPKNSFDQGLYIDSKMVQDKVPIRKVVPIDDEEEDEEDEEKEDNKYFFAELMKIHLDSINKANEDIDIDQLDCGKYVTKEWFHELDKGKANPYDKATIKEAHLKLLLSIDKTNSKGFYISHSMPMPVNSDMESNLFKTKTEVQYSQHAFCNSLKNQEDIDVFVKILKVVKARPLHTTCPSFEPEPTETEQAKECDKKWFEHTDKLATDISGLLIIKKLLRDPDSYKTTRDYCMVKRTDGDDVPWAPIVLGDFELTGRYQHVRKEKSNKQIAAQPKPVVTVNNYEIIDRCFREKFKLSLFSEQDPIEIERTKEDAPQKDSMEYCTATHNIGMDPWLIVAEHYKSFFFVNTDQTAFPTMVGDDFGLFVIHSWENGFSGQPGMIKKNHEKIMFSIEKDKEIFCLGDSNRNDKSPHHSGSIYCIKNKELVDDLFTNLVGYNKYRMINFANDESLTKLGVVSKNTHGYCYTDTYSIFFPLDTVSTDIKISNTKSYMPPPRKQPGRPSPPSKYQLAMKNIAKNVAEGTPLKRQKISRYSPFNK
ncbi:hypothetical protein PPL_01513 [Heterostelium album PN500]|uniref:Uncharacterized protein n=1 Tax=Heterostelium pallidum (strain ATCC 26659 / Pp 5 / PN500) TaxID=670386 RepID=D3AZH1_HETP5|nr:hypothetical protein PPL_01513 [Heterostelium album PN500]EFA85554.1 hypothetical protein PPL_01513 [Heterostelium album PN500]|eukprot:XP_020437662.1 hypothetical protein PPL_01513 [Heterostelium album PN500]